MKKTLLLLPLLSLLMLSGCNQQPSEPSGGSGDNYLKVTYDNDGGANIPTSWNDKDTAETIRKATYQVGDKSFSIEFVGTWYISSKNQEYQTRKTPISYVRSASDLVVKKLVVEVFKADVEVYKTNDHTGEKVSGQVINGASHSDGEATEYTLDSANWSILAVETYKGSNINIYSFTFYF